MRALGELLGILGGILVGFGLYAMLRALVLDWRSAMITIRLILVLIALGTTIAGMMGKCPLWVPIFLLTIVALFSVIPV